ncbi:TPA: di-trans,poly-cis-decaprenylcistransferase [Candidatus Kaiserbacteria bacterium]|nr:MAG: Isoprenyl transferase [Parcubacteria group bacterium GW2011_GWA1_56_13]KKW47025.1 MAG: Isoprenyl transferase [Parcubacteria group bacterium GW2011_GWB1_57_6]HCR52744.1 di-trans,poly-cis-decaprenylcistransferase [Candidatus Kaiserbacteria bacterium]
MTERGVAGGVSCVGVIMDGNRRWARAHNKPVFEGHNEGYQKLKDVVRWARERDIPHLAVYAFSTENWQRAEKEVSYLMKLFRSVLEHETQKMLDGHIRVHFVGDRSRFSADMRKMMSRMERATGMQHTITLHVLVSYGGRAELVAAANALAAEGREITEDSFESKLWSYPMPDPDLVIRTGGETRLSNFLPWQSVYSELFFTDTLWPDFTEEEFDSILAEFAQRERRRGK